MLAGSSSGWLCWRFSTSSQQRGDVAGLFQTMWFIKLNYPIYILDMSVNWHIFHRSRYLESTLSDQNGSQRLHTKKHLSFQLRTFVRFLLPSSKHQSSVHSAASFSLRSLVRLMSQMAIVCLGLLSLWWAAMYADPRVADRCQPHVLSFASALRLFLYRSASLFHTTITSVSFSLIASPVKSQQPSHMLGTEVLWRELAFTLFYFFLLLYI